MTASVRWQLREDTIPADSGGRWPSAMMQAYVWVLEVRDDPEVRWLQGATGVWSVSNSTETARIGHRNGAGTYLGAEDTRQHVLEGECLSDARGRMDGSSKHRNVHSVANDTKTTENVAMYV